MKKAKKEVVKDGINIEVSVDYTKGGINYISGDMIKRGYYLYAYPFKIENGCRMTTLFEGKKMMLLEVKRQSAKAFEEAVKIAEEKEEELINVVAAEKIRKNKKEEESRNYYKNQGDVYGRFIEK